MSADQEHELGDLIEWLETEWMFTRDGNEGPVADFTAAGILASDWLKAVRADARAEGIRSARDAVASLHGGGTLRGDSDIEDALAQIDGPGSD